MARISTVAAYLQHLIGLVDVPVLVQRLSRLRDISQRIH